MPLPQQAQYKMHKSFFDDCSRAIENNFYMEAILMEYAAIEARMEILLGVIGLPCHQYQEPNVRKSIQISHRLNCAHKLRQSSPIFGTFPTQRSNLPLLHLLYYQANSLPLSHQ